MMLQQLLDWCGSSSPALHQTASRTNSAQVDWSVVHGQFKSLMFGVVKPRIGSIYCFAAPNHNVCLFCSFYSRVINKVITEKLSRVCKSHSLRDVLTSKPRITGGYGILRQGVGCQASEAVEPTRRGRRQCIPLERKSVDFPSHLWWPDIIKLQ